MVWIKLASLIVTFTFGYLMASFPTGVVISKTIYKKDIRLLGSGNTGASNAGRVFGKKAFWMVMIIDILKTVVPIWAVTLLVWGFNLYD
jgi:glycerol-3-phosphate acyltransferase PlsY